MKKKHKFKKLIFLFLSLILIFVWIYNNFTLEINEVNLTDNKANEEVRIMLISDLHLSFYSDTDKIINMTENSEPDLIFLLGDMYSRRQTSKIDRVITFMNELSEIADVYVVTGDHDYDEEYKEKLRTLEKVHLLEYTYADINIKGNDLRIYGINNVYFTDTFDLHNEFDEPPQEKINILLSHIPSISSYGDFGFDYIFCGDSHGGMIRLPLLGGIYFDGYILPEITYDRPITDKGLYEFENTSLFVTSGVGHYPFPLRLNNRPEICLIKIKGE